ncbi:hypothetical protein JCM14469_11090 [Desulfatiferula olefinivorans]
MKPNETTIRTLRQSLFFLTLLAIFAVMICVLFFYGRYPQGDTLVSLNGDWKIRLGDDPAFADPGYDDSDWGSIALPGSMIRHTLRETGSACGVLWLRKQVRLPEHPSDEPLGLILGRIGNADRTYVNGTMIGGLGGFPPNEFSMWNHPRHYLIPATLIRPNEPAVIAIRISYATFCEVLGDMAVTDRTTYDTLKTSQTFSTITAGFISMAVGQVLLLLFCIIYLIRPESEEYYYYCLPLLFGQPIIFDMCTYLNPYPGTLFRFKILSIAFSGLCITHTFFLHRIYDLERKRIETVLKLYLAAVAFFSLFFLTESAIRSIGPVVILVAIGVSIYNAACNLAAMIEKKPFSLLFGFFGIGFFLFVAHDGFVYLAKFSSFNIFPQGYNLGMVSHLAAVLLYLGTALVMIKRLVHMMGEVEDLNTSLENYIIENALLNDKLKHSQEKETVKSDAKKISSRAEEKIVSVMQFINDNYASDITRSTLADSFDIHPDSLGKQFKTYTGKKLGDYIYELRIAEAARRLREEETNIIDIAFDVGFESIRTFQRIFPKYMGKTPDQYRRMHRVTDPAP